MDKDKTTTEDLARMVKGGFDEISDKMDIKFQKVDDRLNHIDARMGRMEADLEQIKGEIVYKFQFEDLEGRVKYLETKLGIESREIKK